MCLPVADHFDVVSKSVSSIDTPDGLLQRLRAAEELLAVEREERKREVEALQQQLRDLKAEKESEVAKVEEQKKNEVAKIEEQKRNEVAKEQEERKREVQKEQEERKKEVGRLEAQIQDLKEQQTKEVGYLKEHQTKEVGRLEEQIGYLKEHQAKEVGRLEEQHERQDQLPKNVAALQPPDTPTRSSCTMSCTGKYVGRVWQAMSHMYESHYNV